MKWTPELDELLASCANLGAKGARDLIEEETGEAVSVQAVQVRASRLGLSLARWDTCTRCGQPVRAEKMAKGMCPECRTRQTIARNEMREREVKDMLALGDARSEETVRRANAARVRRWKAQKRAREGSR